MGIAFSYVAMFATEKSTMIPSLAMGMKALWALGPMIDIELLGLYIFFVTGKSSVTTSRMSMPMARDHQSASALFTH
jgi:hypothetical protein